MNRTRLVFLYAALLVLGFLYLALHTNYGVSFLDIGFDLHSALRLAHGQVPYRDFFSIPGPLEFMLMRVLLGVFGTVVLPQLWFGAFVISATCLGAFALVRRFASLPVAMTVWLLTIVLWSSGVAPGYTQTAGLFALYALLALVIGLQRTNNRQQKIWCIGAGVLLALAFWTKQSWGAYLLAGVFLAGLLSRPLRTRLMHLAIGLSLGFAPFVLYLGAHRALDDFIRVAIVHPARSFRAALYQPVPDLGSQTIPADNLSLLLLYAGLMVAALGVAWTIWQATRRTLKPVDAIIICCAAGPYLSWFERFSDLNSRVLLPFMLTATALLLIRTTRYYKQVLVTVALVFIPLALVATDHVERIKSRYYPARLDEGYNAIRVRERDREAARFIREYLATHPTKKIAIGPITPLHYFVNNRLNPTPFDLWIPGHFAPGQQGELIDALREEIDVVLLDADYWHFDGRRFAEYAPEISAVLAEQYSVTTTGSSNEIVVYERKK